MPIQQQCRVVSVNRPNPHAYDMMLEVGEMGRMAVPGQFVHIKCGAGNLLRRPISICDAQWDESEDLMRIVFEVRGEGTAWLSERRPGDRLDVLGPLGHGFEPVGDKVLLVGGGIGVPPMRGCARQLKPEVERHAVLGFRDREHALLVEEFRDLCASVTVTTDDGSLGTAGYVDGQVRALLEQEKDFTCVLACGPKVMLKSVARAAEEYGVPCQVSMEERMGCGVGACLVCACDMKDGSRKHVCKDGPVFDSREVDWDV